MPSSSSLLLLLPVLACVTVASKQAGEHELDPREVVGHARVGLVDAIGGALEARPGAAVEADLEGEVDAAGTHYFFEIMVVGKDQKLYEVKLDPMTGAVLESAEATDADEQAELLEFQKLLRRTPKTLVELVEAAQALVKGQPVSAALEDEDGDAACDVRFVNARYVVDVELEARSGVVSGLELEDRAKGEQDEDHGRGEEQDQEEDED